MTVWISAVLLLLSANLFVAVRALEGSSAEARGMLDGAELQTELAQWSDDAVCHIEEDLTPLADSSYDPVWQYLEVLERSNVHATLADVSSLDGESPFIDIESAPVPLIEELLLEHGVDAVEARSAATRLASLRRTGRRGAPSDLEAMLSHPFAALGPVLMAEPMINVNLAPDRIISRALSRGLSLPDGGKRTLEAILSLRESTEIDRQTLDRLLRVEMRPGGVAPRLGVRTWVWQLTLSSRGTRLLRTIARDGTSVPGRFHVIASRFERLPLGFDAQAEPGGADAR